ncbi:hypothetical protein GUJ93_ZPchr0007g4476 [Zizania palustris]|uniref:Uncharacterized protein n=1 Tax=Zizania palustris TaxID=103762 RepID=A0A8J5SRQ6_ZIZPA|nr:hypothetical protein GUJ93_ZPchr0007g4476 [Zizania palustris]
MHRRRLRPALCSVPFTNRISKNAPQRKQLSTLNQGRQHLVLSPSLPPSPKKQRQNRSYSGEAFDRTRRDGVDWEATTSRGSTCSGIRLKLT